MIARNSRTLYERIAEELREQIADGTFPVGEALPSISRLAQQYEVSPNVVQSAIRELKGAGLVVGQPGKAVYVERAPDPAEPSAEYLEIKHQIDALRDVVDDAVRQLDERIAHLEQTIQKKNR